LLHEIVKRLGDEGHRCRILSGSGKQVVVAVDHATAGGGVASRLLEAVVAFLGRTRRVDRRIRTSGKLDAALGGGEVGIAFQIVVWQDVVPERMGVLRAEPAAPIVAVASELGWTTLRFD